MQFEDHLWTSELGPAATTHHSIHHVPGLNFLPAIPTPPSNHSVSGSLLKNHHFNLILFPDSGGLIMDAFWQKVNTWGVWLIRWASDNPTSFIYTVLLILSPFLLLSAFFSWKLAKHLEADHKKQRAKQKHVENIKAHLNNPESHARETSTRGKRSKRD